MEDDGRALLILGGKLGVDEERRSERYNTLESRGFFYALYQQYAVTQHIFIWGDLYRKQGAGFPIDLIVIEGRGRSERPLPAADVPIIYKLFAELKELIPHEPIHHARFTLDVPVHDQPVSQLSQSLDAGGPGNTVHRQGATNIRAAERSNLLAADANPAGQNDSGLHVGDLSDRDATKAGYHPQQIGPGPAHTDTGAGRQPRLRPEVLAAAVGRDPDSEQLAVSGTTPLLRGELSGNARNLQLSGLLGLAEPARRDHARGVAGRTKPVALLPRTHHEYSCFNRRGCGFVGRHL